MVRQGKNGGSNCGTAKGRRSYVNAWWMVLVGTFAAIAVKLSAATFYVDASKGNDANDGLSPTNAWQSMGKVNQASLRGGDRVLFCRGKVWREPLTPAASGAPGNQLVFGAYGEGPKPMINGANVATNWVRVPSATGIWQTAWSEKPYAAFFDGQPGVEKTSTVELSEPGDWCWQDQTLRVWCTQAPAETYRNPGIEACARHFCVRAEGQHDLVFENLAISQGGNHLKDWYQFGLKSCRDILIRDCDFTRSATKHISIWEDIGNTTIEGCSFSDTGLSRCPGNLVPAFDAIAVGTSLANHDHFTTLVERCTFRNIHSYGGGAHHGHGVYVRNGKLVWRYNFHYGDSVWHAGSAVRLATAVPAEIYGNLFTAIGGVRYWGLCVTTGRQHRVFNNLFHNCWYPIFADTGESGLTVKNNIFYWSERGIQVRIFDLQRGAANWESDFNCFYNAGGDYAFTFGPGRDLSSLEAWKSATRQDAHSLCVDPLFVAPATGDFHLTVKSALRRAGTDIGLNRDREGVETMPGTRPDIGP